MKRLRPSHGRAIACQRVQVPALRLFSTTASASQPDATGIKPSGSTQASPRRRMSPAVPLVFALCTGISLGILVKGALMPPDPVKPGTPEDDKILASLHKRIDELFLTQIYRGKCLGAGRIIRGEEDAAGWREIGTQREGGVRSVEINFEREKQAHRDTVRDRERAIIAAGGGEEIAIGKKREERVEALKQQAEALGLDIDKAEEESSETTSLDDARGLTKSTLAGSQRLAVERVFWNAKEAELVAVVWLGEALVGWPRIVHGGLLATVLSEKLGVAAALLKNGSQTRATDWLELSSLDMQYKKPTYASAFYVIRAYPRLVSEGGQTRVEIDGALQTPEGQTCVEVKGTASTPKGVAGKSGWRSWLPW